MREEDSDSVFYTIAFELLCAILIGVFAFAHGFVLPPITKIPLNFLVMAVLYGLGTVFIFKATQLIEASEAALIASLTSLVAVISAVALLGESFGLLKIAGTLLILAGALLVVEFKRGFIWNKGVVYALGMVVCYGLAITNDAYILHFTSDVASYSAISFLFVATFLVIISLRSFGKARDFLRISKLSKMAILAGSYSISSVTFYSALQNGAGASQMGPINQSFVIVTVLLAAIFLRERTSF